MLPALLPPGNVDPFSAAAHAPLEATWYASGEAKKRDSQVHPGPLKGEGPFLDLRLWIY